MKTFKRLLFLFGVIIVWTYMAFIYMNIKDIGTDMGCMWVYAEKLNAWIVKSNCIYEFENWLFHIDDCWIYQFDNWEYAVDNVRQVWIAEGCNMYYDEKLFTPFAKFINEVLNEHRCWHSRIYLLFKK